MKKTAECPTLRMHLWLQGKGGVLVGHGRVQLLEYVHFMQSLTAAAKALGMSYRAAWGKIRATEALLGVKLLEETEGKRTGCRLSREGVQYIMAYRDWENEVEQYALESAREYFACLERYRSMRDLPPVRLAPGGMDAGRKG